MLTVIELLTQKSLKTLRLVTNKEGLANRVVGIGIYEWENPEEIKKTFAKGEFVTTTLSNVKNDEKQLKEILIALIDVQVSAIAIKEVYFTTLPEEILEYANAKKVPVFFYKDTFMDDILFDIKYALNHFDRNDFLRKKIKELLETKNKEKEEEICTELSLYINRNYYCAFIKFKEGHKNKETLHELPGIVIECALCSIWITGEKGAFNIRECNAGFSTYKEEVSDLKAALVEARNSMIIAVIDNDKELSYSDFKLDRVLVALNKNTELREFYNNFNKKIVSYDLNHGSNLEETLITYIKAGGDTGLTAKLMHQHTNTIRYRITKIKCVLEIEEDVDSYIQMYFYVRTHQILQEVEKEWI